VYEKYKIRFANGAHERRRLLDELKKCNEHLKVLLETSDEDARLVTERESAIVDEKLSSSWVKATSIHTALSTHWECGCDYQASHIIRVPMEHSLEPDFQLVWSDAGKQLCNACYLQIAQAETLVNPYESVPLHHPSSYKQPESSALKSKQPILGNNLLYVSSYMVTLYPTDVQI